MKLRANPRILQFQENKAKLHARTHAHTRNTQ